jgi:hypothetical protein
MQQGSSGRKGKVNDPRCSSLSAGLALIKGGFLCALGRGAGGRLRFRSLLNPGHLHLKAEDMQIKPCLRVPT